jgi:hypothetical protein
MKGRTRVVAVLCLVIAGAWFFWNRQRSDGPRSAAPQANADAAALPSAKADSAAVATRQANVASHAGSLDERPLAEVRAELERRAQAAMRARRAGSGRRFFIATICPRQQTRKSTTPLSKSAHTAAVFSANSVRR